ncbi:hypothetical protein GCM10010392_55930 [Streptomyces clavifer]|nr:hypothetical protein GCM10010392_55930 [Streptomyces clavifer]
MPVHRPNRELSGSSEALEDKATENSGTYEQPTPRDGLSWVHHRPLRRTVGSLRPGPPRRESYGDSSQLGKVSDRPSAAAAPGRAESDDEVRIRRRVRAGTAHCDAARP